jgi:hypothetical protein
VIVSIHQPGYLPWHGLFHRLALSDIHIFFDSTQFEKNGFNNRVKVKTAQGGTWLTVPVLVKGKFGNNPIREARINNTVDWQQAHWKTLTYIYSRAPFFRHHTPFFESFYAQQWSVLGDLNIAAIEHLARTLGIGCRFVRASELSIGGTKAELVLNLCKAVGATVYISGVNGRDYLDGEAFRREGVALRFQAYQEPHYRQLYGAFEPFMSVVDLLFNYGESSLHTIMAGQETLETGTCEQ